MQTLPANIYSVESVREMDRTAIEDHGIPGYKLMSRAGAAATRAARQGFPEAQRWQIVCGAGNNGGDGYVVARLAANDGILVSVLTLVDPESLKGDASKAYEDFVAEGGTVMPWQGELDSEAELLVDAVLGSGLERDVRGEFANAPNDAGIRLLLPGMFARVKLPLGKPHTVPLVAEKAITNDQGQTFVYTVDDQGKVGYRKVTLGRTTADGLWEVREGLTADDRVIVSGIQFAKPGEKVVVEESPMPTTDTLAR